MKWPPWAICLAWINFTWFASAYDTDDWVFRLMTMVEMVGVLEDLQAEQTGRDWFFIHPAGGFGGFNPGERRGTYRDGGDVLVVDENGESFISGEDFAVAVIDEIESPKHSRGRFTVGY